MTGSPQYRALAATIPPATLSPAVGLVVPPGACAFGVALANVDVPLAPIPPARVTEADIYEDALVIYAGDQPIVSIDPASAVRLAEKIVETYRVPA